jgi:hypothetical protein
MSFTEEHKKKLSLAKLGSNNPAKSPEARAKISAAHKGVAKSPEHKKAISISLTGRKLTNVTRIRISEAAKRLVALGKAPNWKGGVSKINKSERDFIELTIEYRLWHEAVLKRDDFTCQLCGVRGVRLHVDHIKPFALFPELRVAIDNGRVLCVPCHIKTPTYGCRRELSVAKPTT